ncbi:hypothetical protein LJC12_04980, partial [Odoribacter sp. OttesenSCG-928-J03]|nr:hypothetical protein [Odoribacter sp. OttesenSCG-928-J03]
MDVTKAPELVRLECDYNEITTLDLSKNTKLRGLECRYNRISLVDLKRIGTLVPRGYIGMQ